MVGADGCTRASVSAVGLPAMVANATTAAPNWKDVKRDAYGTLSTSKDDLSDGVFSHVVVPGLYCNNPDLRTCNAQVRRSGLLQ